MLKFSIVRNVITINKGERTLARWGIRGPSSITFTSTTPSLLRPPSLPPQSPFCPCLLSTSFASFTTLFLLHLLSTSFTIFSVTPLLLLSSSSPQSASTSNISSSHQVSPQHDETLKPNETILIRSKSWGEWATLCLSSSGPQILLCCCLCLSTPQAAWALASKWPYDLYDHTI